MYGSITSKGQTTVPKGIREKLGLKAGDKVFWTYVNGQATLHPKNGSLMDIAGMLYDPNREPLSIEEESEAVMDAVAAEVVASAYRKA